MKLLNVFFVLVMAEYTVALDYDPVNDRYNPNDFAVEILPVSTATDVYNANGTHYALVYLQNKPDTTYRCFDQNGNELFNGGICARTEMVITPNDGLTKAYCIDQMNYLNGYYKYVINIYTRTRTGWFLTNLMSYNDGYNVLVASAYLLGKPSNQAFQNVAIIGDGIDFCNGKNLWTNSRCFLDVVTNSEFNTLVQPTGETALGKGYNLCFVDFELGCGDIRFNAKVMLKIIEKICELAGTNKVTVGGLSMGGQVSRLALLYGQKIVNGQPAAKILNVNKFISIDSPNKGASGVSVSFQNFVKRNEEALYNNNLNQPASKQMLFVHNTCTPASLEHDKFYSFLNAMGNFPRNMKLISIADANWGAPVRTGNCLKITAKLLGGINIKELDGCCWEPNDFLAGSSTGNSLGMIQSGIDPYNNALAPLRWTLFPTFCNPLYSEIYISESPNCEPTFMPITSVFCLKDNTPSNLQNAQSLPLLVREKWTPFHSLYLAQNREAHIAFNADLNSMVLKALDEPGGQPIFQSGIMGLLLN